MAKDHKELELQVLLEEYRMLSVEIVEYLKELFRCLIYAAALVALHLGVGLGTAGSSDGGASNSSKFLFDIHQYLPYGFLILAAYFLGIGYLRVGLSTRRGMVERKVNDLMSADLFGFDAFAAITQEGGFLKLGRKWYARLPTPLLFLGIIVFVGSVLLFSIGGVTFQPVLFVCIAAVFGIIALYVFIWYPRLVRRVYDSQADSNVSRE